MKKTIFYLSQIPPKGGYLGINENQEHAMASYLSQSFPLLTNKLNGCFSRNGSYCYRNKQSDAFTTYKHEV